MPMVNTGFSDVIGSWKIMLISLPRTSRISSQESFSRFAALEENRAVRRSFPADRESGAEC